MRAWCFGLLIGLLAAALTPVAGGSAAIPPLPVPPVSAARDPDSLCAAALGGTSDPLWMLCRNPTGEEAARMGRLAAARRYFRARLVARYGSERMADLASEAAEGQLSRPALERRARGCLARARRRR